MRCPRCAADISPLRDFCPRCGASTDSAFDQLDRPRERSPEELSRNRKTVLAIGGAVLLLAVGMGNFHNVTRHVHVFPAGIHIDTGHESKEPVTIGAAQLFEAYHTDSHAADRQYGGRQMVVTGEFVRTVPDGYGSIDMRLKTNHPDLPLGIDLDSHSVDAATKLEAGQTVTVSCRKVAGTGDDPWLQECVIQPAGPDGGSKPAAPTPPAPPGSPTSPTSPESR